MPVPSINFLHPTVSEIQPGQTFSRRPPAHPDTVGENNTLTALKGCGVKTTSYIMISSQQFLHLVANSILCLIKTNRTKNTNESVSFAYIKTNEKHGLQYNGIKLTQQIHRANFLHCVEGDTDPW